MDTAFLPQDADRASLDALGLALLRTDAEGRIAWLNPAAEDLLGWTGDEAIGSDLQDLLHPSRPEGASSPRAASPLVAALAAGRPVRLSQEVLWRRDGTPLVTDLSAGPLPGGGHVVLLRHEAGSDAARDRLTLQLSVSRLLAGTADLEDVLPRLLAVVTEGLGAQAGVIWALRHRERRLVPQAAWPKPSVRASPSEGPPALEKGEGPAGRAWAEDEVVAGRREDAVGPGYALAIPARSGRRVLGVVELLFERPFDLDGDLRDSAEALGQQVGQYLRRRRAEEALRAREEEFRTLAEHLPQLIWMADAAGTFEWVNRRWTDYAGSSAEAMANGIWRGLVHPEQSDRVEESYRQAIETGEVWEQTFLLRGADGGHRWYLARAVPIPDEEGEIRRWFGTATDITDRRRAEARAVAAERRLRFALQVARIGSWTIDFEAGTLEADDGLRAVLGLPAGPEPMTLRRAAARLHREDAAAVRAALNAARDEEGEFELEFRMGSDSEGWRWVVARGSVERRAIGRGLVAIGIAWDVTDAKLHEQDLAAARDAAEAANRAKSQFIANMSHELRTPLSAIIGYAELLAEETEDLGPEGEPLRGDLARIEASARHLLSLINGILDLSKIEAGKMEVHLERFDVASLLREVSTTVEALVERNGNRFVANLPEDLGEMHSDPVKVRQCLFNLLSNAAKFTEGGEVRLSVRREDGRLRFRVADTGIGMTAEQQERLFQRFAQADASTTRRFGGTGLGLALTRAFGEMLGGTIEVESEEGRGTVFTLALPADAAAPVPQPEPAEATDGQVLVIDDDPSMRDLLLRFLSRDGLAVAAAADGAAGLRLARELKPSAILLDVMMPRMDGWAVLSALKADPEVADIPVIMISMMREKGLAYSLGAADYLTKPVDWARLKAVVDRHRVQATPGRALVLEPEPGARAELARLLEDEGWKVEAAADPVSALARMAERRIDLLLVNLAEPEAGGFGLLRDCRRDPSRRGIPVIALAEGELPPGKRAWLCDQVRQVVDTGGDGMDELLAEIRQVAAERASERRERTDG